jgi:Mg2+ and Co2+ transporter CorA
MSERAMTVDRDIWREFIDIVRQAEELAYSSEWRTTAKTMRKLRHQLQSMKLHDVDSWMVRFRIAQQIFMDRRADFYVRGNRSKGADLQKRLAILQQKAGELRESIQYCHNTIKEFQKKSATLEGDENRASIDAFISESCGEVNADIEKKNTKLLAVEEEIVSLSSRFCSA